MLVTQDPQPTSRRSWNIRSVTRSLRLPPDRRSPRARRRLAETPAERPIEMRDIAKAGFESNIDDRQMKVTAVGQHCEGVLKPAFHEALCERLSSLREQLL